MIHLDNVSFSYEKKPLFLGLTMYLQSGHIYGLLGANGVGKTTLLKLLAGLVFPKGGMCKVLEQEPRYRKPSFMSQLYFVADEPHLPHSTAARYADNYGVFYPNFDKSLYLDYLKEFQVSAEQVFSKLSFGQRKKVVISFALATNVPLVLMDEPTNGLDIPSKSTFRRIVAGAMTDERSIVISTHQVRDLDSLIDAVLILHQGKIVYNEDLNALADKATAQPNLENLFQEVIQFH